MGVPSFLSFLLLLCSSIVVAQNQVGVDICACQPPVITISLNFTANCVDTEVNPGDPGISDATCATETRDQEVTDNKTPVLVSAIQILEVNEALLPVGQSNFDQGSYFDGATFSYTSIVERLDITDANLPRGFQIIISGINSEEVAIVNTVLIQYTNDCGIFPLLTVGQQAGWAVFTDLGTPGAEFCPAAAGLTSAPAIMESESPSESPSASPMMAEVDPTDSPTAAPVEETETTESPVAESTDTPTESPQEEASTDAPTESPQEEASTDAPTESPQEEASTDAPTESPVEEGSTDAPIVAEIAPTESPVADVPATESPVADVPATEAPVVAPTPDNDEDEDVAPTCPPLIPDEHRTESVSSKESGKRKRRLGVGARDECPEARSDTSRTSGKSGKSGNRRGKSGKSGEKSGSSDSKSDSFSSSSSSSDSSRSSSSSSSSKDSSSSATSSSSGKKEKEPKRLR